MKLTASVRPRRLALAALAVTVMACSSGGGTTTTSTASPPTPITRESTGPRPVAGDIERTTFAPSLNIHLDSMTRRASGLYVQDLVTGAGGVATQGKTVVVSYTGWLPNGKEFDSGEITVTIGANKTIRAWEEALLGMRAGGRRRLISPPALAYGSHGSGEIPPNAVLVFEMEVRAVL